MLTVGGVAIGISCVDPICIKSFYRSFVHACIVAPGIGCCGCDVTNIGDFRVADGLGGGLYNTATVFEAGCLCITGFSACMGACCVMLLV